MESVKIKYRGKYQGFTLQRNMVAVMDNGRLVLVYRPDYWSQQSMNQLGKVWKRTASGWVSWYVDDRDFLDIERYGVDVAPMWDAWEGEKAEYEYDMCFYREV